MQNALKKHILEIDGNAQRQYIDAKSVFTAHEEAKKNAADLRGELERHRKLNKVFHVGRAPELLVAILNKLAASGLADYFTVIGTHSLYAYEAAAGVRFEIDEALATNDVDLLWDTRKRLSFIARMEGLDTSFLGLLREVDPKFDLRNDQLFTAVNNQGFEVDVIRREAKDGDPHPLRLSDHEEEFYAVQAKRAGVLLDGEKFSAMIVSSTGRMARMTTISPVAFTKFKRWMAKQEDREPLKRYRDILQAEMVEELVVDFFRICNK